MDYGPPRELRCQCLQRAVHARVLILAAIATIPNACHSYHPMSAAPEVIAHSIEPPEPAELARAAAALKHPSLPSATISADGALSPQAAAVVAVIQSPMLRAARMRRGVAEAQLLQAGLLPNPQLVGTMDFPIAGATNGTVDAFGVGASWDVTSLITLEANKEAAAQQVQAVQLDVAWQEWQVAMAAKLHATRVLWLALARDQLQQQVDDASRLVQAAEYNTRDGFTTRIEKDAASGLLQKRRAALLATEATLRSESCLLRQAMGLPNQAIVRIIQDDKSVAVEEAATVTEPSPNSLDRVVDCRLDLVALRAGYESEEAKLHSAVLSQFPRIALGILRTRDTSDVGTLGFGVTIELPIFDDSQGHIAIETATRQQLFNELASRTFDARADASRAWTDLDSVRPQIAESLRLVLRLKELERDLAKDRGGGDADIVQLNQVRNDLADARIETLHLRQQEAELRIAIELATGQLLGGFKS